MSFYLFQTVVWVRNKK